MTDIVTDAIKVSRLSGGPVLAAVQFFFTLSWTVYAIQLPGLLGKAGIALSWLPLLLMADQLIFAMMDIAFGVMADKMTNGYRRLARLMIVLATVSAFAFLMLPILADISAGILLLVLGIWVFSASVIRAPTLVLLAKHAKLAQQQSLVIWYVAGIALASALSPFLGLWMKGFDPRLPFVMSALSLLIAVIVLKRVLVVTPVLIESEPPRPISFAGYLPLLLVLAIAGFAFQLHAFVNASALYKLHATNETLPWLMPLLWVGFFAMLIGVGKLIKRFGMLAVAVSGVLLLALASYAANSASSIGVLIVLQMLCGAGWAMGFAGLMERAAADGTRGAEGLFMGSFFAVTALSTLARIAFVSHWLADWKSSQFILPAALLLTAGVIAAFYGRFRRATVDAQK